MTTGTARHTPQVLGLLLCLILPFLSSAPAAAYAPARHQRQSARGIPRLPSTQWHVQVLAALPGGESDSLYVWIDTAFKWPSLGESRARVLTYSITLISPEGQRIPHAGRITSDERFSLITFATRPPVSLFDLPSTWRGFSWRGSFTGYRVVLVSEIDGKAYHQEGAKTANAIAINWGTPIPGGDLKGKDPETAAQEQLDKAIKEICDAQTGGKPRFPKECEQLKKNRPRIACMLPKARGGGIVAGKTDPISGTITINGDAFLTEPISTSVLVHEGTHALDIAAGKKERAWLEWHALSVILDNADFFGYPGTAAGTAFIKQAIKDMIGEQVNLTRGFPPAAKPKDVADALTKIRDWIKAHPDIKANMDKDPAFPPDAEVPNPPTWSQFLDQAIQKFSK